MTTMASQITSLTIVYSTVYSGADQRKYQSSASLAFVWEIHRGSVNSPHKWPVTRKMFPFDDVIMLAIDCGISIAKYVHFIITEYMVTHYITMTENKADVLLRVGGGGGGDGDGGHDSALGKWW